MNRFELSRTMTLADYRKVEGSLTRPLTFGPRRAAAPQHDGTAPAATRTTSHERALIEGVDPWHQRRTK